MKLVRDRVVGALKLWKNIADPEADSYIAHKIPSSGKTAYFMTYAI